MSLDSRAVDTDLIFVYVKPFSKLYYMIIQDNDDDDLYSGNGTIISKKTYLLNYVTTNSSHYLITKIKICREYVKNRKLFLHAYFMFCFTWIFIKLFSTPFNHGRIKVNHQFCCIQKQLKLEMISSH